MASITDIISAIPDWAWPVLAAPSIFLWGKKAWFLLLIGGIAMIIVSSPYGVLDLTPGILLGSIGSAWSAIFEKPIAALILIVGIICISMALAKGFIAACQETAIKKRISEAKREYILQRKSHEAEIRRQDNVFQSSCAKERTKIAEENTALGREAKVRAKRDALWEKLNTFETPDYKGIKFKLLTDKDKYQYDLPYWPDPCCCECDEVLVLSGDIKSMVCHNHSDVAINEDSHVVREKACNYYLLLRRKAADEYDRVNGE